MWTSEDINRISSPRLRQCWLIWLSISIPYTYKYFCVKFSLYQDRIYDKIKIIAIQLKVKRLTPPFTFVVLITIVKAKNNTNNFTILFEMRRQFSKIHSKLNHFIQMHSVLQRSFDAGKIMSYNVFP